MTQGPPLIVERIGDVACIRLQRPRQLNAINPAMVDALDGVLTDLEKTSCRALVLTGGGRAFCVGADLAELPGAHGTAPDPLQLHAFLHRMKLVCDRLESFPAPTIASVNGLACAGGLELLLCCDIVVASAGAQFGDMHANYGLLPGAGASLRLPQRIGLGAARLLMYSGELWDAAELHRLGLVQRVYAADELESQALRLAVALATKSPLAAKRTKQLLGNAPQLRRNDALSREIEMLTEHARSVDMREGLRAFAEKRSPVFIGT
jgi:enoyl-CoA hydratase